jgi:hypothetical protein
MAKKVMDRRASDNKYFHQDFHISTDNGICYLGEKYGDNGVKEFLQKFAKVYYQPLIENMKKSGFSAMQEHILKIYEIEGASDAVNINLTEEQLDVEIAYCPAIAYMKKVGSQPSKWYVELTRTINETIANCTDLGFELLAYDTETGAAKYRFFRRCF